MSRPKSESKRNAILAAAIRVFAQRGLAAPTSAVSKAAGVAEGTLFTYFPTKADLVNAAYRDIKAELAGAVFSSYPRKASVRERLGHVWDRYVEWGARHPAAHRVLKEIELWEGLTDESRASDAATLAELATLARTSREQHLVRKDASDEYVGAVVNAMQEMTISLMIQDPPHSDRYRALGFDVLWAGITAPPRGTLK
jgi:AcrR family transcriptional regulator